VIRDSRSDRIYDEILFSLPRDGVVKSPSSGGFRLTTLMVNKQQDLALLRASSLSSAGDWLRPLVLPAVEVDDSTSVQLLDDIYIIGFPEKGGLTVTVNRGTVEGVDALGNWIKTDGRLMRGNSGGAAVDSQGKLIGVPTKVIADSQPIDKDGDGFPEDVRVLGAVGFLRPSKLVAAMVNQLSTTRTAAAPPRIIEPTAEFNVRGIVKSAQDGRPVAGALVGLLPAGATVINETTLLAWGTANPEGVFVLNKPVPAGQYRVKVKAISYDTYQRDIEIDSGTRLVIELSPSGSGGYLLNGAGELSIHLPDPKPAERSLRIPTTGLFTAVSDEV
jgi:S1-C subfamily serine protease